MRIVKRGHFCAVIETGDARPCPFCGQDKGLELMNGLTATYWVQCLCGAQMNGRPARFLPGFEASLKDDLFVSEDAHRAAAEDALRNWNARPE